MKLFWARWGNYFSRIFVGLFFIFPYLFFRQTAMDDAFITARHSFNLAKGQGLLFNPGEWVLGTTSPLWALATHWIFRLPFSPEAQGILLAFFSGSLVVLGAFQLSCFLMKERPSWVWPFVFAILIIPSTSDALVMGMETGALIFLFVQLLKLLLQEEEKSSSSSWIVLTVLAWCLLLIRLDSIWVLLAFSFSFLWVNHPAPLKPFFLSLLGVVVLTCIWLGVCQSIYGYPVPHSMIAKSGFSDPISFSFKSFFLNWGKNIGFLFRLDFPWPMLLKPVFSWLHPLCVFGVMLFSLGQWTYLSKSRRILVLGTFTYCFLYSLFFVLGRASIFPWYGHLLCFLWFSSTLPCLAPLKGFPRSQSIGKVLLGGLLLCAITVQLLTGVGTFVLGDTNRPATSLGKYLKSQQCQSVMLEPIGYIGFFSECRKVLDLAGLVSPEILAYRRTQKRGWFFEAVRQFNPQFVVLRKGEIEKNLGFNIGFLFGSEAERETFLKSYAPVPPVPDLDWTSLFTLYQKH